MEGSALLTAILLFLFAAVVTVPIARRLGIRGCFRLSDRRYRHRPVGIGIHSGCG